MADPGPGLSSLLASPSLALPTGPLVRKRMQVINGFAFADSASSLEETTILLPAIKLSQHGWGNSRTPYFLSRPPNA